MNPVATLTAANGVCESDSDSNSDSDSAEYYQPISSVDIANGGEEEEEEVNFTNQDPIPNFYRLAENGLSSLDLSDDEETTTESESAIERAFREDEMRRTAPLPAENAVRVMEAMRRISFAGDAPLWAGEVSDDQWIDRLRRLRRPSNTTSVASVAADR